MLPRLFTLRANQVLTNRFYTTKLKQDDFNRSDSTLSEEQTFNGPKQYNIESNLLKNKLVNEQFENEFIVISDSSKYFEKETKYFLRHLNSVEFYKIPNDEKLQKRHEYFFNSSIRITSGLEIRKFEALIKNEKMLPIKKQKEEEKLKRIKEKEEEKFRIKAERTEERLRIKNQKEEEKLRIKKEKEEERMRIKKEKEIERNKIKMQVKKENENVASNTILENDSNKSKDLEKDKKFEEISSPNEFILNEEAKKIIILNKQILDTPDQIAQREDKKEQTEERKNFKKILIQEEQDQRDKKIKRYLKFLANYKLNESYLIGNLNRTPILPRYMVLENREFYNDSEIQAACVNLFKKDEDNKIFEDHCIPSVSNIINVSTPLSDQLLKWKLDKVISLGLDGFKLYSEKIKLDGIKFHDYIEKKLTNQKVELYDENLMSLDKIFKEIDKVVLTEFPVLHSNLFYKGRIDCLAYYKGNLCLIDWKQSEKSKPDIKDMYDAPIQISAYIGAFLNDPKYEQIRKEHKIKNGLLVNYNKTNGEIDVHLINYQSAEFYWYKWLSLIKEFWIIVKKSQLEK